MKITRNKEQQLSMIVLYDALTYVDMNEKFDIQKIFENIYRISFDDIPSYSKLLVIKSLKHLNEIIKVFQDNMETWNFDRLNRLERSLLIMSYAHKKYVEPDIGKNIIIDVAVNLAKKYLDSDDFKFVNGILDKVL